MKMTRKPHLLSFQSSQTMSSLSKTKRERHSSELLLAIELSRTRVIDQYITSTSKSELPKYHIEIYKFRTSGTDKWIPRSTVSLKL